MNLSLFHVDDALSMQPAFLAACDEINARHRDLRNLGKSIRLWAGIDELNVLRRQLRDGSTETYIGPNVTWMGSGDFHHVTALLIERTVESMSSPPTIIHFDNHPDWVMHTGGLHCGSWVRALLDNNIVERIITVGVNSRDVVWPDLKGAGLNHVRFGRHVVFAYRDISYSPLYPDHQKRSFYHVLSQERRNASCANDLMMTVASLISTRSVYISIDKDVLLESDATTNWDQGVVDMDALEAWLMFLLDRYHLAGLDVVGDYSSEDYSGSLRSRCLKRAETFLDHRKRVTTDVSLNERGNMRLLATLRRALC